MPAYAEIDVRMKENYEHPYRIKLTKRIPVIVRVDGKAFHTFTKGFRKPFDVDFIYAMQQTMKYLCENVEGCMMGYCQSDEISLLLVDYKSLNSQSYFDYNIQKIASICASMATLEFNRTFAHIVVENQANVMGFDNLEDKAHAKAILKGACFDARCFNIPKEEVTNYFYSREIDAIRNSIEMVGRAHFSQKQLHQLNGLRIKEKLKEEAGVVWDELPLEQQRGSCCIKEKYTVEHRNPRERGNEDVETSERTHWVIDHEIPIFSGDNRDYIDKYVFVNE